jgi:hypothetical protein
MPLQPYPESFKRSFDSENEDAKHFRKYRVIHKSLRDFRTLQYNNQDRHSRKEHINR